MHPSHPCSCFSRSSAFGKCSCVSRISVDGPKSRNSMVTSDSRAYGPCSQSHVNTIFSGGLISRYVPDTRWTLPPLWCISRQYFPPTCNSSTGTSVEYSSEGANQRPSSSGSVQARNTLSRGAWKVLLTFSVVSGDNCSLAITEPPSAVEPGIDPER